MEIAAIIISLILLLYWIFRIDMVDLFSPIISTSSPNSKIFKYGLSVPFLVIILLMIMGVLPSISFLEYSDYSSIALLIATIVAVITMLITTRISPHASVLYAFMASLVGIRYFTTGSFDLSHSITIFASWIAAPVLSMLIGMLIFLLYENTISKSNVHLFEKARRLRYLLLISTLLMVFSLCVNNGSVLLLFNSSFSTNYGFVIMTATIILVFCLMSRKITQRIYQLADLEFDISFPVTISIILSSSIVLLLFSFDGFTSTFFLKSTPISIPSLLFASMAGIGILQKKEVVPIQILSKNFISILITPVISIIITFLICTLLKDIPLTSSLTRIIPSEDFNLNVMFFIGIAAIGIIILVIMAYQKKSKNDAHDISFSQQQLMYENQNELNSLEIKTIMAENHSLYSRLEAKRKELVDVALNISEQKEFMENLYDSISKISTMSESVEKDNEIEKMKQYLFQRMSFSNEIDVFYAKAEMLHKDFSLKLREKFPNLTTQERKLATLLRLGFSTKEISTLMNISVKSGEISRYRLRKKLGLTREDNLIKYIKSL